MGSQGAVMPTQILTILGGVVLYGACSFVLFVALLKGWFMFRHDRYGYTVAPWPRWLPHRHQWKDTVRGYDTDTGKDILGRQCTRCRLSEDRVVA